MMPLRHLFAALMFLCSIGSAAHVHALMLPQPLPTDSRIKTLLYSPNEIYKFIGHYGYQSVLEFGADEQIMTVSIGDTIAWQIQPAGSRIFIKPVEQNALTNMTVITTERTYHFELHANETEDIRDEDMTFVVRFLYLDANGQVASVHRGQDATPDLTDPETRASLNFDYAVTGSDFIEPLRIFDDGEFTYFEFRDKNADVPAFYLVDGQGNESIVNFRTVDNYIVVERVASQFTLRHGAYVLCVFNETRPMRSMPREVGESFWNKVF